MPVGMKTPPGLTSDECGIRDRSTPTSGKRNQKPRVSSTAKVPSMAPAKCTRRAVYPRGAGAKCQRLRRYLVKPKSDQRPRADKLGTVSETHPLEGSLRQPRCCLQQTPPFDVGFSIGLDCCRFDAHSKMQIHRTGNHGWLLNSRC